MITDLPGFMSVNKLKALPRGRYFVVESIYQRAADSSALVTMSEILTVAENRTVAVDLHVLTDEGELRFRDFCLTPAVPGVTATAQLHGSFRTYFRLNWRSTH